MDALLPVANILGRLLSVFSIAYLMPIAAALIYDDGTTPEFIAAMLICLGAGLTVVVVPSEITQHTDLSAAHHTASSMEALDLAALAALLDER